MRQKLLFLCPHSAAKSVIAAVYAERLAGYYEIDLEIDFAGTDPDQQTSPAVVSRLLMEGFDVSQFVPRHVTAEDIEGADWVISMGCNIEPSVKPETSVLHWDDVPPPSEDLDETCRIIEDNLLYFLGNLSYQGE
jgi:protein-tyrosine-phosphatase